MGQAKLRRQVLDAQREVGLRVDNAGNTPDKKLHDLLALLRTKANKIRKPDACYARSLNIEDFAEIRRALLEMKNTAPEDSVLMEERAADGNKAWHGKGHIIASFLGRSHVAVGRRSYMIPKLVQVCTRQGFSTATRKTLSELSFIESDYPLLLNAPHLDQRMRERSGLSLDCNTICHLGVIGTFLAQIAEQGRVFESYPASFAAPTNDGLFLGHMEPVSREVPERFFGSRITHSVYQEGAGSNRVDVSASAIKYVFVINSFVGKGDLTLGNDRIHQTLIDAIEHSDIANAIIKSGFIFCNPAGNFNSMDPDSARYGTAFKSAFDEFGGFQKFTTDISQADLSVAIRKFCQLTSGALRDLSERTGRLPEDARIRVAAAIRQQSQDQRLAVLRAAQATGNQGKPSLNKPAPAEASRRPGAPAP